MSKLARLGLSVIVRKRRTVAALAAGAAVLVALTAARGTGDVSGSGAAKPTAKPEAGGRVTRAAATDSLAVAARTFAGTYVSFLYGRRAASAVTPVSAGLHRRLLGAHSTPTPAELARAVYVRDLTVDPSAGATATATAVVDDGASPPYALSFNLSLNLSVNLSFSDRRWLVTAVRTDGR